MNNQVNLNQTNPKMSGWVKEERWWEKILRISVEVRWCKGDGKNV